MKKKKISNKKGQAALEYLLTYGWAILIVIIVGASLYALGVFTPGQWTGKRQSGFAQFRVVDFKLDTTGNLTVVFQNQIGKTVTLNDMTATLKGVECSWPTSEDTISPSGIYTESYDCGSVDGYSNELKTSYSISLDFYYEDPDSGLSHIDSGTLFGAVEEAD